MATSCIPAAIDYLVAQITALPECAAPVVVHDGWPDSRGDRGVVVGITPEDDDSEAPSVHAALGAQMEYESPIIPCLLWSYVGGGSQSGAMKSARDAAFVIYNAIITKVRADRTLGGAVHSGAALVTGMTMRQTGSAAEAGSGRICEIRFVVSIDRNRF
jgi:hypothetical protein